MQIGTTPRLRPNHSFKPARLAALAVLLVSAVLVTAAGVAIGGALQDRFEAGPTASETEALNRIDTRRVFVPDDATVPQRGPNRADLGGGRADLGAAR
ncbi:MAG: hypothetical protein JHD16_02625 [Solirubrobacteraceae bacterium]|nr:hypothetical protein [Solirubrobacteraceae bacterium]